jgi:hypothetical protein
MRATGHGPSIRKGANHACPSSKSQQSGAKHEMPAPSQRWLDNSSWNTHAGTVQPLADDGVRAIPTTTNRPSINAEVWTRTIALLLRNPQQKPLAPRPALLLRRQSRCRCARQAADGTV